MSSKKQTKNDKSWEKLFAKYDILDSIRAQGVFYITSEQINEFREARLMTKFDYKSNLPVVFQDNDLSILPVTRGTYVISHFDAYGSLKLGEEIIQMDFPDHIQSLNYQDISSEAVAVNCAFLSGMLGDFVEDRDLLPTVNGRMSSDAFDFKIINTETDELIEVSVENAQIEIDAGFEGVDFLTLIEAKNSISEDFLIRQIYYPYRLWSGKIDKKVKPVFMVYTNGVFHLYEYEFVEPDNYNSMVLVKQKSYSIERRDIELADIQRVLLNTEPVLEPEIPFPQADSFERIINLCEILREKTELTKLEITSQYDFTVRQTEYYTDSCRYLGLIEKKGRGDSAVFCLTAKGRTIFKLKFKDRQLQLAKTILEHQAFSKTLELNFTTLDNPSKADVVSIMKELKLYKIGTKSTYFRRASTILAWINWILDLPQ